VNPSNNSHLYFWAKTIDGLPGISVLDHCLNVGTVAQALLRRIHPLVTDGVATMAAAHDVGKISPGFESKSDAWTQMHAHLGPFIGCETDHAKISQWVVQQLLNQDERLFGWAVAVGAHHGKIKGARITKFTLNGFVGDKNWEQHRMDLSKELIAHFGPLPAFPPREAELWWLAGLITVADWIGSDETFFKQDRASTHEDRAARAEDALNTLRWGKVEVKPSLTFCDLFPDFTANAMQQAAFDRITTPGLYIIEAPMGDGKTELALSVAYTLISKGDASGIYFALPTQVTSNRIHERVEAFVERIAINPERVRLAHSAAWLRKDSYILKTDEAVSWFASSKRALLCPFGVGTVDQTLLGVVAAKHFFLRQFGLAGKVVILDEVHSYDLYTGTLIDTLVKRLRELGATVIIASATLTASRREQLLKAANAQVIESDAYPLLTLAPGGADTRVIPFKPDRLKDVQVSTTTDPDASIAMLCLERAQAGACVLWIRNTVADAQASFRLLRATNRQGGPPIGLLHSRFPLWRRDELESFWLEALGKSATNRPSGCVLIATQVVEQSVDIDSDLLVTDLAPSDILFQRMGRLWRHKRPKRIGEPHVLIHTLELASHNYRAGSAKDLKKLLGRSRYIYAPYVLVRTFDNWINRTRVTLPSDIRTIIEATYSDPSNDEPEGWIELRNELETNKQRLRDTGINAALVMRQPQLLDEEGMQTRINDIPTAHLLLATAEPVESSKGWISLQMIDGSEALIPKSRFDIDSARIIHRNVARIPARGIAGMQSSPPEWLSRAVSHNAVLGCVHENGEISINQTNSGMTWNNDEGIALPTNDL
jgi:CRISPR-associated endonuclease/helicase Cas3